MVEIDVADETVSPAEYSYSYQVLDHRKPEQLLKFKVSSFPQSY